LAATEATKQTVDDVKSTNNKIQARRAKAVEKPDAKALAAGAEPVKTASTSQQSYDKLIDHFAQLIATLTAEPKYLPNENELKVATLNTMLTDLRAKNTAVINATTALSNARIARDKALYGETTGMVDVAQDVKQYVNPCLEHQAPNTSK
jgi:propanediol dehydratase large subunit